MTGFLKLDHRVPVPHFCSAQWFSVLEISPLLTLIMFCNGRTCHVFVANLGHHFTDEHLVTLDESASYNSSPTNNML